MTHRKALIKLIEQNSYRHDRWRVFGDFVELAAISLSNAVDLSQRAAREARYLEIVSRYEPEEVHRFPKMLAELVSELEAGSADVLGEVFMEMDLGSKWHGQFFTPFHLCRVMAQTMVDDQMRDTIERKGFISINEPACGGAAMIIALADEMRLAKINYQRHMHVVAQDVDEKAVHMAYVQLSLLHIPAIIIHGNTLSLEERSHWYTPAHILGGWNWKLSATKQSAIPKHEVDPAPVRVQDTAKQFSLLFEEVTA